MHHTMHALDAPGSTSEAPISRSAIVASSSLSFSGSRQLQHVSCLRVRDKADRLSIAGGICAEHETQSTSSQKEDLRVLHGSDYEILDERGQLLTRKLSVLNIYMHVQYS